MIPFSIAIFYKIDIILLHLMDGTFFIAPLRSGGFGIGKESLVRENNGGGVEKHTGVYVFKNIPPPPGGKYKIHV